jgi:SH3-like domain-containing protein
MMKKKLFVLMTLMTWLSVGVNAQSLGVFISDNNGPYTNIRNAPKGKVIDKISTKETAMIGVEKPTNGWWKIIGTTYDTGDKEGVLKPSATGHWIHYSVLAMGTRNYGGQTLYLRKDPSATASVVYTFKDEIELRPMDIKGDWVKVQTSDGKHTGWIEAEWLCGNALTNCC